MMVTGTVVGRAQAVAAPGRDPAWLLKLELEFRSRRAPPAGSPAGPLAGSDSESRHNTSAESESAGPPARPRRPGPTVGGHCVKFKLEAAAARADSDSDGEPQVVLDS